MPDMTFTSVDLPAPLSPTRPTTSPARTSKSTPPSACTAPKRFVTPCSASSGSLPLAVLVVAVMPGARFLALRRQADSSAGRRIRARADLVDRIKAVSHDRVGDVVLGHGDRREDHARHVLVAVVDLSGDEA